MVPKGLPTNDGSHSYSLVLGTKELCRVRATVKKRRILLKEWFQKEDPRREEVVSQVRALPTMQVLR